MKYNNDLPGGKQVTKGNKKQQPLYIIWIIPLYPRLENLMKWMWLILFHGTMLSKTEFLTFS
jgi:hypothetical protein